VNHHRLRIVSQTRREIRQSHEFQYKARVAQAPPPACRRQTARVVTAATGCPAKRSVAHSQNRTRQSAAYLVLKGRGFVVC
jgi:hypothetical protein